MNQKILLKKKMQKFNHQNLVLQKNKDTIKKKQETIDELNADIIELNTTICGLELIIENLKKV